MKNCPLCNTPPKRYGFGNYYCPNEECNLYATPVTEEQWNNRPIEQQLVEAARALCDIASEYSNGCGCCGTCTLDETPEFKQLDAVLQSITGGTNE